MINNNIYNNKVNKSKIKFKIYKTSFLATLKAPKMINTLSLIKIKIEKIKLNKKLLSFFYIILINYYHKINYKYYYEQFYFHINRIKNYIL